jgi:mono/diheme cytochrome c family protein
MSPKILALVSLVLATALGTLAVLLRQQPVLGAASYAIPADDPQLGRRVYARCQACHGLEGLGIRGNYPPLAGAPRLLAADPSAAIQLTLKGAARGALNGQMPAFADLADHEIAAVLTWTRSQWGNAAPAVTPEQVARLRSP